MSRATERLTAEDRKMIRGRPDVAGGGYAYLPAGMILSLLEDAEELDRAKAALADIFQDCRRATLAGSGSLRRGDAERFMAVIESVPSLSSGESED